VSNQSLNEVLSILADLNEAYLELARKIAAMESFVIQDTQSRGTYQEHLSQLGEINQATGQGFECYERCEMAVKRIRELLAVGVPPVVREKSVERPYDPDAHLGRRGSE
jgi:hypothetical protein